jgi:hypothetical protein
MDTNRLVFTDLDQSQFTIAESAVKAFFVVNAPRGNTVADLFQGGSFEMFIQRLGVPTRSYPGLKEAYDYVVKNGRSAWISAPPGISSGVTNYYGGVYLTTVAKAYSFYKVTDVENPNYYIQFTAGSWDSPTTNGFDKGISVEATPTPNTVTVDNIPLAFYNLMIAESPNTDAATPFTLVFASASGVTTHTVTGFALSTTWNATDTTGGGSEAITGTVTTGTLGASYKKISFTGMSALDVDEAGDDACQWKPVIDATDYVIASIYQKSPRENATSLTLSNFDLTTTYDGETNPYYDTFKLAYSETITDYATPVTKSAFYLSPVAGKKDGQGSLLDMNSVLDTNNLIGGVSYLNTLTPLAGYVWATTQTVSTLGTRAILLNNTENLLVTSLTEGWTEAGSTEYSEAVLFVEPECYTGLLSTMASLRTGTHTVSNFITGVKFTQATPPTEANIISRRAECVYNKGISYSVNEFYMTDYLSKYYWHIPVGHVATMLAQIIEQRYGGVAPMWLNESGLGGQLTTFSAKKRKYKFSADDLDNMDANGFNPIVLDSLYGYMLTSQKTAQSPSILTDWSFLGHQMAFDSLKREMRTNVMIPQLGKPINDYYLDLRARQTQSIVDKRISAGIWAETVVLVKEVNTDDTRAQNKFVIKIRIKVNPFSEFVELILLNVGQDVAV